MKSLITLMLVVAMATPALALPRHNRNNGPVQPEQVQPQQLQTTPVELAHVPTVLLETHNGYRARHGLPPLVLNPNLVAAATEKAQVMARMGSMNHYIAGYNPGQCASRHGYPTSGVAENIAMGQRTSREVSEVWYHSSGHRANILGGYNEVGFGAHRAPGGAIYWAAIFGKVVRTAVKVNAVLPHPQHRPHNNVQVNIQPTCVPGFKCNLPSTTVVVQPQHK